MDIFPSEYIHIGGDECPKVRWEACPKCQAKIRELGLRDDRRFTAEQHLQAYCTKYMGDFLAAHGRKLIGWDEILEGDLPDGATVMSWRGTEGGVEAAHRGYNAVMSPYGYCYFDYCQGADPSAEPLSIGGYLPVEKVYGYDPVTPELTAEEAARIIGVQANLWTEYIPTPEHAEYMALPRMDAVSEVQWCAPGRKDYADFLRRLERMRRLYDRMGVAYGKHVFEK